jgi:hypothetical protein
MLGFDVTAGQPTAVIPVDVTPPTVFVGWGFEPVWSQDLHRNYRSLDTAFFGSSGIDAPFIPPPPPTVYVGWGFEPVWSQDRHPKYRSLDTTFFGSSGIDAPFIPPPPQLFVNWGFEPVWSQDPNRLRLRQHPRGRSEFAVYTPWVNIGFEQVQSQNPYRRFRIPDIGSTGIDVPSVFVPPTVFVNWGFEPVRSQDLHHRFRALDIIFFGSLGIDAPFIFIPGATASVIVIEANDTLIATAAITGAGIANEFYVDNVLMRRDDKPQYVKTDNTFTVPGFGRGN